jgi:hypothetical protein
MRQKQILLIIVVLLVIGISIFLYPVEVTCRIPGSLCATAPDNSGYYYTSYDIEPFGVMIIERIIREDIPIKYSSGETPHKVIGK